MAYVGTHRHSPTADEACAFYIYLEITSQIKLEISVGLSIGSPAIILASL